MTSIQLSSQAISLETTPASVVTHQSPLARLMTRPAVSIPRRASLTDAVDAMEAAGVSALLVDGLGGIITERDIARALGHGVAAAEPVERVATPHPLVVPASISVVEACGVMLNEQVRHLVVELADGCLGVVSLRDVAAVLLQAADPHLWLASLRVTVDGPAEIWLG